MAAAKLRILARFAAAVVASVLPVGAGTMTPGAAGAASFDCSKAANPTEVAICADARLSVLDARLQAGFDARVRRDPGARQTERGWILARNAGCDKDVACIRRFTQAELAWLQSAARRLPSRLPIREGACALSAIRQIGSRLEGMPESGSAVAEANGGYQVSYDVIPAIQASSVGDPALVCLVSIPRHCPRGDTRGRVYAVANLRTLGAWSEADAEHLCGGA
jgi:uncharacterized protein